MLSAAPAPEGGAVKDWDAIRSHPCYDEHQPGCDCAALATREEAPAETGELDVLVTMRDHYTFALKGPWPGILTPNYALAGLFKMAGDEIEALRAQPPARSGKVTWHSSGEDEGPDVGLQLDLGHGRSLWLGEGQKPNGWQFSLVQGDDIIPVADVIDHEQARDLFDLIASAVQPPAREDAQPVADAVESGVFNVEAAFEQHEDTHPAPDALRVAVEALKAARPALPNADAKSGKFAEVRAKIDQALAALQAEQKGGAA